MQYLYIVSYILYWHIGKIDAVTECCIAIWVKLMRCLYVILTYADMSKIDALSVSCIDTWVQLKQYLYGLLTCG